ncbi:ABC transporter permease [Cohnella fermenti]|uniref:ABC transporter permease n=1 Tax=Cohnella fermenti TaxID=2565925 RepID=A0A4S4BHZ9_9BACL|nr:ABC-2 family transporter protein [Cohnella fermenti]THF74082.1 ABC transporter permease [Cohnella fermenti]
MNIALFGKLIQLLIKEKMAYRGDFLLSAFAQIVSYGGEYIVIWLFMKRFPLLAGWTWPEIALLYSFGLLTYAIGASFSFVQMRELEGQVRQGTFDNLLIKPINPYFYLISRGFNLAYVAHITISGAVLIWAIGQLNVQWTLLNWAYVLLAVVSGAMIQAGLLTAIGAATFLWVRAGFLFTIFFRLKEFISYPLPLFGTFIQLLLTIGVPLAFVNFYPAAFLLAHDSAPLPGWAMWLAPLVGPLVYGLGYLLWTSGANKYQGAGG